MTTIDLTFPKPYPLQAEIINHPAKRKVICAGRRAGKTTMAALMTAEAFLRGKRIMLSSTSQDQADAFWEYLRFWLSPLTSADVVYKNESRRIMRWDRIGAFMQVKTGRDPDSLRSKGVDLLVLDECAFLDPRAWNEVAAPMLLDTDGDAVFISTPKRKNWFYHIYLRGRSDGPDNDRWQSWNFSSHNNPHLSEAALDELTRDMTDETYRQEILAEFLDAEGTVFRNIDRCTSPEPIPANVKAQHTIGIDWGRHQDFTVITVVEVKTGRVVEIDRFKKVSWFLQQSRVKGMASKYRPAMILAESNSIGDVVIDALTRDGVPITPFMTTNDTKRQIIENLALALETEAILLPDYQPLLDELSAFEFTQLPSGRIRYEAPDGIHDDTVISLALAWFARRIVAGGLKQDIVYWDFRDQARIGNY